MGIVFFNRFWGSSSGKVFSPGSLIPDSLSLLGQWAIHLDLTQSTKSNFPDFSEKCFREQETWRCPWKRAVQGEGPIGLMGPISQPRGTIDTVSRTLLHTNTLLCVFCSIFYSWQLRAICILICRGAVSHRARI